MGAVNERRSRPANPQVEESGCGFPFGSGTHFLVIARLITQQPSKVTIVRRIPPATPPSSLMMSNCDQLVPCSMRKKPKISGATNRRRSHKALSDAGDAIFPLSP
ncbi:MAG: hypothetical protein AAEJ47_03095, partial [Planctomycetota bacterium]